jgi:hypothetical protein
VPSRERLLTVTKSSPGFASVCGESEEALNLLEIALAKKRLLPQWARHDPEFASIKDDPRFGALVGI